MSYLFLGRKRIDYENKLCKFGSAENSTLLAMSELIYRLERLWSVGLVKHIARRDDEKRDDEEEKDEEEKEKEEEKEVKEQQRDRSSKQQRTAAAIAGTRLSIPSCPPAYRCKSRAPAPFYSKRSSRIKVDFLARTRKLGQRLWGVTVDWNATHKDRSYREISRTLLIIQAASL
ncbi:hypothetical protein V1478_007428 [Vespula squamosa]|uniref:Uncharacterized protein n=1 Tax=Vespula squamosa TaxID=30214 RepID=A0ABD2B377_VESSQ